MTPAKQIRARVRRPLKEGVTFLDGVLRLVPDGAFHLQEETMTEVLLAAVADSAGPGLDVTLYSKQEEGRRTGADWEWWWGDGDDRWFGLRVQAKRVKHNLSPQRLAPGYDFSHTTATGFRQIDLLIESAGADGTTPVYVLYDDSSTAPVASPACPLGHRFRTSHRATVIAAEVVRDEFDNSGLKASRDGCIPLSVPLPCILCTPDAQGSSPALATLVRDCIHGLRTPGGTSVSESARSAAPPGSSAPEPPGRVRKVLHAEATDEDLGELDGIAVIREVSSGGAVSGTR